MPSVCCSGVSCCEGPRHAAPPVRWSVSRPRVGPSRVVAHRLGPGTPPAVCSTRLSGLLRSPPFCPTGGGGGVCAVERRTVLALVSSEDRPPWRGSRARLPPLPREGARFGDSARPCPTHPPGTDFGGSAASVSPSGCLSHRESVYSLLTDLGNVLPSCGTKRASFISLPAGL